MLNRRQTTNRFSKAEFVVRILTVVSAF